MPEKIEADISLNMPQFKFSELTQKYRAFVAGYGTGKSVVGCYESCKHFWEHPKVTQGYFAPTYPQIRDIYYPTIEEIAFMMGLRADIKESNKEIHFYSSRWYRGTTICRSMEKPSTIVGFKIGHAHVDELDVLDAKKAKQAWRKIIARLRWKDDSIKNGADVTTTPEGFKETYRLFVEEVSAKPELAKSYGLVQASTYDNEANLPDDYIQSLIDTYPKELIEAYLDGQFVNLTSGTIYRSFNRNTHNSTQTVIGDETLRIGMDFNVGKMAATVYVVRNIAPIEGWHAVAEFKDLFDTPDMIKALNNRFPKNHKIIYPDASGGNRSTNNASESDLSLLRQAGFEVRVNTTNPAVKDRIMSVNKQFQDGQLYVNVRECPTVAKCLEQQAYDDNGEPDKKSGFDHQNDATGYPIAFEFPIEHNRVRKVHISGF
jgi:hypothetical protein